MNIYAQILGGLAILFWIISVQNKKKKNIILNQMIANLLYTIQYSMLGVFSASSMNFTSTLRSLVFYQKEKNNQPISKIWLIIFLGLVIAGGIVFWDGYLSLIPIIITLFYTYSAWCKETKFLRIVFLCAAIVWIYYNYRVGAYICIIGNSLEIVSGTIALIRFKELKKKKRKKKRK